MKQKVAALILLFGITGCSTPVPFREVADTGNPSASRITINSINEANLFDKTSVLPGKVYINGVFYGEFSNSQRNFSIETLQGAKLIVVCPEADNKCINMQVDILPNKHYKYKYTLAMGYYVVMANYRWSLVPVSVDDYYPANSPTSLVRPMISIPSPALAPTLDSGPKKNSEAQQVRQNDSDTEKKLEVAKGKCLTLGFQLNTQSFGECVMKLAK